MHSASLIHWFREAAPFINAHRGQTIVVYLGGDAVASGGSETLLHDLALISALGVRVVVVHGTRPQVTAHLHRTGAEDRYHGGLRVTDSEALQAVKEAAGATRVMIESVLSRGIASTLNVRKGVKVASGNFVVARPIGIRDGIDFQYTGEVRRIDAPAINDMLDFGTMVLISPLGYSATGEVFNLNARDTAVAVAVALHAGKLLILAEDEIADPQGHETVRQLTVREASDLLPRLPPDGAAAYALTGAIQACQRGVQRAHIVQYEEDGAVVRELFTRDGSGTMVSVSPFDLLREATIDDVAGILALIEPLEREGILVRRSREKLEQEIEHFAVLVREGTIIACGALYPFASEKAGEIACIAVHEDYRKAGFGDALLARLQSEARSLGLGRVFVLTTHAIHWFIERGFERAATDQLPGAKQALYNYQRNSQVLIKNLGN
ncbi:MAG: amino-acid N-acetyltransferase [Gammaproteobacteria bacterium]|nr:amino-acid N-acetyltransferase [Gammaproteobacteria bacterium]